ALPIRARRLPHRARRALHPHRRAFAQRRAGMKSLTARNPRKRFASVEAVRGVDLDLLPGETLALVGESGSGKSTIARLVLQLIPPDAGSIELDGQSLVGLRGDALRTMRRRLQIIFQDPYGSLDPTLSIR